MMRVAARSVVAVEDMVTTPQLRILMLISGSGPQSIGSVAAELNVHPSNATRPCEKLVQAGLIVRSPDRSDRRFVQLELTDRGAALVDHVLSERRQAMAQVFEQLSPDEQAKVTDAFELFAIAAGSEPTHDGRFAFAVQP
ncbi:MarR family transcriptional regulator [Diaminobutyricibacter tongyongensis]|uniref:MarR family transcriptional regulator n=2 Tax=Leifsonia tongyongensis TaxID=1268043 RepID=A0A6L9XUJ3_9MICO|nr:MarR family transcriptional regulator [Diaminobutyricibacter tongyongensis]NEN04678.1 MarR family transcriptional regulator [Diaminobutyricibacter tongyongensis]